MRNRYILILIVFLKSFVGFAQEDKPELDLYGKWSNDDLVGSYIYNNTYNEVWGVVVDGREYGIIGSTNGTHFIDLDSPDGDGNLSEVTFVAGAAQGGNIIHRDFHDMNGYLYVVCDEGKGISTLQIMDLQYLPDSVAIVYDSNVLFTTSHNIFIDTTTAKLYVCAPGIIDNATSQLHIYSLILPDLPILLAEYSDLGGLVHDLYVRNDTAWLNLGYSGLLVADFSDATNYKRLGSLTEYLNWGQGYNHSGWLSDDGQHYYFTDENHSLKIKTVDVADLSDMKIIGSFGSDVDFNSMAHNLIYREDYVFVSYYHDGLQIFDVSNPLDPIKVGDYNTYEPEDHSSYRGAWGVYPSLPSGRVLLSDMQAGFFAFNFLNSNELSIVTAIAPIDLASTVKVTPSIFKEEIVVSFAADLSEEIQVQLYNLQGESLLYTVAANDVGVIRLTVEPQIPSGCYLLEIVSGEERMVKKIIKE